MSPKNPLVMALTAMFFQQSFVMVAKVTTPIAAAVAFPALGADANHVGVFTGFYALCQTIVVLLSGDLIRRFGGLRLSQWGLFSILLGMVAACSGSIWAFALTAIFVSFGVSVTTPAASHILSRYTPAQYAPLIFSAKQTAVPIGQIAAGVLVPFLVALYGWRGGFLGVGLMCFAFAFALQPARRELDKDRDPSHRLSPRNIRADILFALRDPGMRPLVTIQCAFTVVWSVYAAYFVVFFMGHLGFGLAEAGGMYALSTLIGLPGRMVWGYVASKWLSPNTVLALLGLLTTVSIVLTGLNAPDWPTWALLAVAVVTNMGLTGWQGVALSEVARRAPPGKVGAMTGSVIGLSAAGQVVVPPIFAGVLLATDSYLTGFAMTAVPITIASIAMLRGERRAARAARRPAAANQPGGQDGGQVP